MDSDRESRILLQKGVKPTPNRILVLRELLDAGELMSFSDIDTALPTLDRSSIFRVLGLFVRHNIVHSVEGGDSVARYEVCHGDSHSPDDMHTHFYCTQCHRTYCFEHIPVPQVSFPDGFTPESFTYMAKGICPRCAAKS